MALDNARLYHETDALRLAAEAANRSKSQFLGMMSHELRTPLNAIGGFAELLEMGLEGPMTEKQRTALGRIKANQVHLLTLITEILNFVRIESGRMAYHLGRVSLPHALVDVTAMLSGAAEAKKLTLATAPGEQDVTAWADADRVRQILLNLVMNAVKYTAGRRDHHGVVRGGRRHRRRRSRRHGTGHRAGAIGFDLRAVRPARVRAQGSAGRRRPWAADQQGSGSGDEGRCHGGKHGGRGVALQVVAASSAAVRVEGADSYCGESNAVSPDAVGPQWPRRVDQLLAQLPRICAGLSAAIGAVTLLGWFLGRPEWVTVLPGLPPMEPNAAVMAVAGGVSLVLVAPVSAPQARAATGRMVALRLGAGTITSEIPSRR